MVGLQARLGRCLLAPGRHPQMSSVVTCRRTHYACIFSGEPPRCEDRQGGRTSLRTDQMSLLWSATWPWRRRVLRTIERFRGRWTLLLGNCCGCWCERIEWSWIFADDLWSSYCEEADPMIFVLDLLLKIDARSTNVRCGGDKNHLPISAIDRWPDNEWP